MREYTTTIKHLVPGMIVRARDCQDSTLCTFTVRSTAVGLSGGVIWGDTGSAVIVEGDTEITVLHTPDWARTLEVQDTRVASDVMNDMERRLHARATSGQ